MTTLDLMARLADYDVCLGLDAAGGLVIEGPEAGILDDPSLLDHLRRRKREIVAILRRDWPAAVAALVRRERLDDADRLIEEWNERGAILQFEANHSRHVAEEVAYHDLSICHADGGTSTKVTSRS